MEAPWHELLNFGGWMPGGYGLEGCFEIGGWFDNVELAGCDERRGAAPVSAAFVMGLE